MLLLRVVVVLVIHIEPQPNGGTQGLLSQTFPFTVLAFHSRLPGVYLRVGEEVVVVEGVPHPLLSAEGAGRVIYCVLDPDPAKETNKEGVSDLNWGRQKKLI